MKRKGFVYDKMSDWMLIKQAERISVKGKNRNKGVIMHRDQWMRNLVEIQDNILGRNMRTGEYKHEKRISGQGKMRDIAKLDFHPSHIQHQLLVLTCDRIIDRSLIRHTYASRTGYGQHRGALQLNRWVQQFSRRGGMYQWYLQLDICKYYDNIPHEVLRNELGRRIKDKAFVDAMIEPFEKFSPRGVGIPLGIRPSQICGNLALSSYDRFVKEDLKCHCYIRYLDDMVLLCRNRAEAKMFAKRCGKFLNDLGFRIHEPRIDKVANGIDFLGYKTYPYRGMFWRTSNKKEWLRRRSRVTNPRRLREIDSSAWGYIKHGNKYGKKLYRKMNGVSFEKLGIKGAESTDKNGRKIIDANALSMAMVLDKPCSILDVVSGVETKHGGDRVALLVEVCGCKGKLIVNAPFKTLLVSLWEKGVTKIDTRFIDKGGKHYDMDLASTNLIEVNNRLVSVVNGNLVFADTNEMINLNF